LSISCHHPFSAHIRAQYPKFFVLGNLSISFGILRHDDEEKLTIWEIFIYIIHLVSFTFSWGCQKNYFLNILKTINLELKIQKN
jgi:hypothetical protein